MKLQRISTEKVTKRYQKQKTTKKEYSPTIFYKHNFRIRLKNTLNNKTQESWISHAWLTIHWLEMIQ